LMFLSGRVIELATWANRHGVRKRATNSRNTASPRSSQ